MTELKKALTLVDLVFLILTNVVGAGVFVILTKSLAFGGRHSILAFVFVVALLSIISGLTYVEISHHYASNVAEYMSIRDVFGEHAATLSSALIYFFAIFSSATIIIALSKTIYKDSLLLSVFFIALMGVINFFGIDVSKAISNSIGAGMVTMFLLLIYFGREHISFKAINKMPDKGANGFLLCSLVALFLYNGYDVVVKMHDEIKDVNDIPNAMFISLAIITFFYVMLLAINQSIFSMKELGTLYTPLYDLFHLFTGPFGYSVSYAAGTMIMFTTAFVSLLSGTRFMYGMAKENKLPAVFAELSPYSTPHWAIAVSCALVFLLVLTKSETFALILANLCGLLMLIAVNIALIVIRYKEKEQNADHYHMPLYYNRLPMLPLLPIAGFSVLLGYAVYLMLFDRALLRKIM